MKRYIIYIASAFLIAGLSSCEDTLTEKPDSFYEKDTYFTSESKAEMAIYGIYSSLSDQNHYGSCEMATPSSDDTYYINGTNTDGTRRDISHYMVTPTNTWLANIWRLDYEGIDRANLAIASIEKMAGYDTNTKLKQLDAEARFLRAFQAFDLVKYWGDVPFKTTYSADYASAFGERVDREKIYDAIIEDLNFAKENLPWATAASSPERATQGAARALLMRVCLQRAGYSLRMNGKLERPDETVRQACFKQVVEEWKAFAGSSHGFYADGYEGLFRSFNQLKLNATESIFEIAFDFNAPKRTSGWWGTYNGPEVAAPVLSNPNDVSKYMGRANAFFRVVPEWYNFFDANDSRRDVMICQYKYTWDKKTSSHVKSKPQAADRWYPGKWRREWMALGYLDPNCTDVNFCPLRYADVVLMAAEAYNEIGQPSEAWNLINQVRARAGAAVVTADNYAAVYKAPKVYDLPFISDGDEQGRVRTALYWERGFELAFEGQRKFDLIRWGVLKEALTLFGEKSKVNSGKTKPYPAYINFQTGKHELFPIPLSEMQSNPKLEGKNNPGY